MKILICQTIDFDKGVLSEALIIKMEQRRRERILIDSKDRVLRQSVSAIIKCLFPNHLLIRKPIKNQL